MAGKNLLEVEVKAEGAVTVVLVKGAVDSATLDYFKDQVEPVCAKSGARVLLECSEMTYVNSRAIGLLMKCHRQMMMSRGHFALCGLNAKLVRTLDLLQIGKSLTIYPNKDEALAALST